MLLFLSLSPSLLNEPSFFIQNLSVGISAQSIHISQINYKISQAKLVFVSVERWLPSVPACPSFVWISSLATKPVLLVHLLSSQRGRTALGPLPLIGRKPPGQGYMRTDLSFLFCQSMKGRPPPTPLFGDDDDDDDIEWLG